MGEIAGFEPGTQESDTLTMSPHISQNLPDVSPLIKEHRPGSGWSIRTDDSLLGLGAQLSQHETLRKYVLFHETQNYLKYIFCRKKYQQF